MEKCLGSVRRCAPGCRLLVIDHFSSDGTVEIARHFGAELLFESVGLGFARQMAFEATDSRYLAFVDSDVEVVEPAFFSKAERELERPEAGAVVGMALGHRFAYGLPAGLLLLRKADFGGKVIPPQIDARETYFIQARLDSQGLKTVYLADAMRHDSKFRESKPEWEGANTRIACGVVPAALVSAFRVVLLMSLNSRSLKNLAYVPVFYLKFLRGFANPGPWARLARDAR